MPRKESLVSRQLPPAHIPMVPVVLAGTGLWAVALVVFLVGGSEIAKDTAIAGIALGALAWPWARRMDRKLP